MRALLLEVFEATLRMRDVELKQWLGILRSVVTRVAVADVESYALASFQKVRTLTRQLM